MVLRQSLSGRSTHPPLLVLYHHPDQKVTQDIRQHQCKCDRILTYGTLLDVLWLMYHTWITYGTVRRIA